MGTYEHYEEGKKKFFDRVNPKKLLYVTSILLTVAMVILMSIPSLVIDLSNQDWGKATAKTIMLLVCAIPMMIVSELWGSDNRRTEVKGKYQTALNRTKSELEKLDASRKMNDFDQWFDRKHIPERAHHKKWRHLTDTGISGEQAELILKNVGMNELAILCPACFIRESVAKRKIAKAKREGKRPNAYLPEGKIIKLETGELIDSLHYKQGKAVLDVLEGRCELNNDPATYYHTVEDVDVGNSEDVEVTRINREQIAKTARNRRLRHLGLVAGWSLFAGMLVYDFVNGGADDMETYINLAQRLFAMIGGFSNGWITGIKVTSIEADSINKKYDILKAFDDELESGAFKPLTGKEELKARFEAQKEEEKKAVESVVDFVPKEEPTMIEAKPESVALPASLSDN